MKSQQLFELELFISKLLRLGVMVAGLLLLFGWMTHLQFFGNPLAEFQDYKHIPFVEAFSDAWEHEKWSLVISYIGLCVLISLPLIRVLMTAFLFAKQKEKLLACAAALVFVALVLSFCLGIEI